MSEIVVKDIKQKMEHSLQSLREQLARIHTGRASTALVEDVLVDYYGSKVPIKQIASIAVPEPRQLLIQPWDKAAVSPIEKAIQTANLGFATRMEGPHLRVIVPELTEDRRKELTRSLETIVEKTRISIRTHRQDGIKAIRDLESDKQLSEDESRHWQKKIQDITDECNQAIEGIHKSKITEIMTV